jgi:exodeoxyribonuclease-3
MLRWFERLTSYVQSLLDSGAPVIMAGDFNVMPTELDVYAPERWVDDALFRPEVREAYRRLVEQGWTDALRALHRASGSTPSGNISGMPLLETPGCALIICC